MDFLLFACCCVSAVMSDCSVVGVSVARSVRGLAFLRLLVNWLPFRFRRFFFGDGVTAGVVVFCVEGEGSLSIAVSTRLSVLTCLLVNLFPVYISIFVTQFKILVSLSQMDK